jgi:hypothetical protein
MGNQLLQRVNRNDTYAGETTLEVTTCGVCGVLFAAPQRLLDSCREDGDSFFCPNGHSLVFNDYENKRLKRQLERERDRNAALAAQRDQAEAEARTQKGRATRFRNDRDRIKGRVAAGVCPCCNRTFKNLERHMASQHPDWKEQQHDGAASRA